MPSLFSKLSRKIQSVYRIAEDFIEEEREFALSQVLLNATIQKYVTDNVDALKDLHADIHDGWLRLYATLDYSGLYATLSVDLKLVQMELNRDVQLLVFEQISETQVIEARFSSVFKKIGFNVAVFFFQKVLKKDPLGMILEKLGVVEVKHDLLYLDLNRWLGKVESIMSTLRKIHVNHALLRETEFVLLANVNIAGILKQDRDHIDFDDDVIEDSVSIPAQK